MLAVGEELQALVGDSVPIYKAFNTIGKMHFEDPTLIHPNLTMLYAGPAEHQAMVRNLLRLMICGVQRGLCARACQLQRCKL